MSKARARKAKVTDPGYLKGRPSPTKGMKLPREPLTLAEVERLMDSFPNTALGKRSRAMIGVMTFLGVRLIQLLAMRRPHYNEDEGTLVVPATDLFPERVLRVDARTKPLLDEWIAARREQVRRATAPLFCSIEGETRGGAMEATSFRKTLRRKQELLGIEKRVSPNCLRATFEQVQKQAAATGLRARVQAFVDEAAMQERYPSAYEAWRDALDLYEVDPVRHADNIGHDCRHAMQMFAEELAGRHGVDVSAIAADKTRNRIAAVIGARLSKRGRVREFIDALLDYWLAVSNLAQRQEHVTNRPKDEPLGAEDARRLLFQTLIVMFELDRVCPGTRQRTKGGRDSSRSRRTAQQALAIN
jgi:hypothetical protein